MSRILSDKEIRRLLGGAIVDGAENLINPNGIELRLGSEIRFPATGEKATLEPGKYVKVRPGETLHFISLEKLDFSREEVGKRFPGCVLMAIITPTTTMMREAVSHPTTKVDPGFRGYLNWSLRNSAHRDFILGYGEPVFKLTIWLLEGAEVPEQVYGEREKDGYQNTTGILASLRRVPADLPEDQIVESSTTKLDPKKQLREAGYPFNHIGSELVELHGKFELVTN